MKTSKSISKQSDLEISLALNEAIANIPNPETLFQVIYEVMKPIFHFEVSVIILPKESNPEYGEIFMMGMSIPEALKGFETKVSIPISDILSSFDPQSPDITPFSYQDLQTQKSGLAEEMEYLEKKLGVVSFVLCPLIHRGQIIGHLNLGNQKQKAIPSSQYPLLRQVGKIIASAVASTIAFSKLSRREQDAQKLLIFTTAIMNIQNPKDFYLHLADSTHKLRPFLFLSIHGLQSEEENGFCAYWDSKMLRPMAEDPIPPLISEGSPATPSRMQVHYLGPDQIDQSAIEIFQRFQIRVAVQIILQIEGFKQTTLTICGNEPQGSELLTPGLFEQIGSQLYLALHNLFNWEQIQSLKNRLQLENRVLFEEIVPPSSQNQVIGQSQAFRKILSRLRLVAPNDTTVMLLGETGTGKEVMARYLHDCSLRHDKPMVRVNCAALPAQLIESELFGHEKGSFTGAVERRLGKFELAQGGSLFLDEIGELPLESQAKLLRVLQEREFERVGGHQILQADVRVIVATNRNLAEEVRKGTFRSDLFFRLSVFPITLPPLRERQEDIPLLAEAFLRRAAKKIGRAIRPLDRDELDLLTNYSWPGNIRELEHVLENAAILARESEPNLRDFRKLVRNEFPQDDEDVILPLEELLRTHILKTLRKTKGRVGGSQGAAAILGMNPKTLDSKMRKLHIQRNVNFA